MLKEDSCKSRIVWPPRRKRNKNFLDTQGSHQQAGTGRSIIGCPSGTRKMLLNGSKDGRRKEKQ